MLLWFESGFHHYRRLLFVAAGLCFLIPARAEITGAPEPPPPLKESPLSPEEQRSAFTVPPGFQVELVAAEPDLGKPITVVFDHVGRMWTMTAFEYPIDANESPGEARALFAAGGRDRILVFDTPAAAGRQVPRVFAERVAMPLGVLPYRDGAFVQFGSEIRLYRDTDRDGRSDRFDPVLTGFGIEDSHLFPHQFTRAPGGWILVAQGAFNYSKVRTQLGDITDYNKTKLARFTPDGKRFEVIGWGPCNIWGLVLDRHGEIFIQEANDQRWPMMPFLESGSYPLCGDDVPKPYAPPFPKTGERDMGGTGLSGLALTEGGDTFPAPWRDVFFIANPITGRIQAIRVHRALGLEAGAGESDPSRFDNGWLFEHLPDFLRSADPWFRPIAIHLGPDGCLYVVDWYNKIISHNEVPRNHPERDKTRGRIWRIRHESQAPRRTLPNLELASNAELLRHLQAASTWEVNAAWQEIIDRQAVELAIPLAGLTDAGHPPEVRIRALWCLEGLGRLGSAQLVRLMDSRERPVRKEALRAWRSESFPASEQIAVGTRALADPDRLVRQEGIRLLSEALRRTSDPELVGLLAHAVTQTPNTGGPKYGPYFDRFETYLVRATLEQRPGVVQAWLSSQGNAPAAARILACLALGGASGARELARVEPSLGRPLSGEELVLLAGQTQDTAVRRALDESLARPGMRAPGLRALYERRSQLTNRVVLGPVLTAAARELVGGASSDADRELAVSLAAGFRLEGLENVVIDAVMRKEASVEQQLSAVRALREIGSGRVDVFRTFVNSGHEGLRREAVHALAASKSDNAVPALLEAWFGLTPALRKAAVDRLGSSPASARGLLKAVQDGVVSRDDLDGYTLDKMAAVLGTDPAIQRLQEEIGSALRPVVRLNGDEKDWVETGLKLKGAFTVEAWLKLDPIVSNADSLLSGPGTLDLNFHDGHLRVFGGPGPKDVLVARKATTPDVWTHVAVSRDAGGRFSIYLNGELDAADGTPYPGDYLGLDVGRSSAPGGTAGELAEFRVWSVCRSADEIRGSANRSLAGRQTVPGLLFHGSGTNWGRLHGSARIERTQDYPPVATEAEVAELDAKFARYRSLAAGRGDALRGQGIFKTSCGVCHLVRGTGGNIGPVLDGAGSSGTEALLRNVLTPNAAMEAGYRRYRLETTDGDILEGLFVAQENDSIILRQPNAEDLRIPRARLKRWGFQRGSVMPEGLLEGLPEAQVTDLFAYLGTLR